MKKTKIRPSEHVRQKMKRMIQWTKQREKFRNILIVSLVLIYVIWKRLLSRRERTNNFDLSEENEVTVDWNVDGVARLNPNGSIEILKRDRTEWTIDVKANWNGNLTTTISSALVVGFQGFKSQRDDIYAFGTGFAGPGLATLSATDAATQQTRSSFLEVINSACFFKSSSVIKIICI